MEKNAFKEIIKLFGDKYYILVDNKPILLKDYYFSDISHITVYSEHIKVRDETWNGTEFGIHKFPSIEYKKADLKSFISMEKDNFKNKEEEYKSQINKWEEHYKQLVELEESVKEQS